MKNKKLNLITKLSLFAILLAPVSTVIAAQTDSSENNNQDSSVMTTDGENHQSDRDMPIIKDNSDKKSTEKSGKSVVQTDKGANKAPLLSALADGDYSDRGFTWDTTDPNTLEVHNAVVDPALAATHTDPTYYNQLIVHKSGSAHLLKEGDILDVTSVTTVLDNVVDLDFFSAPYFSPVTAIPKVGFVTPEGGTIDPDKIQSFYGSDQLNASDLNAGTPAPDYPLANKAGQFAERVRQAGVNKWKFYIPNDFPLFDLSLGTEPEDTAKQAYYYAMPEIGSDKNQPGGEMVPGMHFYSTYHIKYIGATRHLNNIRDITKSIPFGSFGSKMGYYDTTYSEIQVVFFKPLMYDGFKLSGMDLTAKNETGNDNSKMPMTYYSDKDLQTKTMDYTGTWDYNGNKDVSIYYKINSNNDDLTTAIKLDDADVDQATKTFKTTVKSDANNKYVEGKNNISFYSLSADDQEGEADGSAYFKLVPNNVPVVSDVTVDPTLVTQGQDVTVAGNYADQDSDKVSLTYQIDDGQEVAVSDYQNKPATPDKSHFSFKIAKDDVEKLANGTHTVHVFAADNREGKSVDVPNVSTADFEKKIALEMPAEVTFKPATVGDNRILDPRDTGWDQIKLNDNAAKYTVYQSEPWVSGSGDGSTLNPIEMVSDDVEYQNHRGASILGSDNAVDVVFNTDGTLKWKDNTGLFQPIGTGDLGGNYVTELTWVRTDAPSK